MDEDGATEIAPGAWSDGLTPKQARFAEEYLVDLNGSAAARRAGYSANSAYEIAYQLLRRPKVAEAISKLMAERPGVTRTRIVDELARIAFANAGDYFEWGPDGVTIRASSDLTEEQRSVIAEASQTVTDAGGTIKIKLSDKQGALEKLARTLGMFTDKHEVAGKDGAPLIPENTPVTDLARWMALMLTNAAEQKETK